MIIMISLVSYKITKFMWGSILIGCIMTIVQYGLALQRKEKWYIEQEKKPVLEDG